MGSERVGTYRARLLCGGRDFFFVLVLLLRWYGFWGLENVGMNRKWRVVAWLVVSARQKEERVLVEGFHMCFKRRCEEEGGGGNRTETWGGRSTSNHGAINIMRGRPLIM